MAAAVSARGMHAERQVGQKFVGHDGDLPLRLRISDH